MKIIKKVFFLLAIAMVIIACGSRSGKPEEYSEELSVSINGKPVLLPYAFHLKKGMLSWNIEGELSDTVGIGERYSDPGFELRESLYDSTPQVYKIAGKVNTKELGGIEFMKRGNLTWLIFLPKPGAKGRIKIEFNEIDQGVLF